MRVHSKKIWIRKNGVKHEFLLADIPDHILEPYNSDVGTGVEKELLIPLRPMITLKKNLGRYAKDQAYLLMRDHIVEAEISGAYAGLAANYIGEIFAVLSPYIRHEFNTFERNATSYKRIEEYLQFVRPAYPFHESNTFFNTYKGDIVEQLLTKTHNYRYNVIDLDFMSHLTHSQIDNVTKCVNNCMINKAVVAIWQTVGRRAGTNKQFDEDTRPYLAKSFKKVFDVSRHDTHDYWEGFPLRVDIFTIAA